MKEEMREVEGFPGYVVSNKGEVFSRNYTGDWRRIGSVDKNGYVVVQLCRESSIHYRYVHALVLNIFCRPREKGEHCRHLNGIRSDNRLENLKWGTPKENGEDRVAHGTSCSGLKNGRSKLSEEQVYKIRSLYDNTKISCRIIGERFGVSAEVARRVGQRRSWKHLIEKHLI